MGSQVPSSSYSLASDSTQSVNASYPSLPTRQVEQEWGPPSPLRLETSCRVVVPEVSYLLSEDMQRPPPSWCDRMTFIVGQLRRALSEVLTHENFLEDQLHWMPVLSKYALNACSKFYTDCLFHMSLHWMPISFALTPPLKIMRLPVDRAFLDVCLHLWDPQAHVFQFGTHYEEMCLTYEEFAALLGSDSKSTPVAASIETRLFKSFMRMLGMSVAEASELVVDDLVDLARLIKRYLDPLDFVDLERQRFRT
ncbi:hypothetical protein JCGZ_27031 [Jatropha curcas]|uniref:Uncharacterized protein n=1 Tax=Jatropha curcas TaxID=180498 RepID=A0A067JMJ0_JATCU|nr:hypothetical protein JCGZ_27031 [Jatropha curcas]